MVAQRGHRIGQHQNAQAAIESGFEHLHDLGIHEGLAAGECHFAQLRVTPGGFI